MQILTHAQVKSLRQLHHTKGIVEQGLFLLEGEHLVEEAHAGGYPLECIIATRGYAEAMPRGGADTAPRACAEAMACGGAHDTPPVYLATSEQMERICDTITPQGVCAVAKLPCVGWGDVLQEPRVGGSANLQAARVLVFDGLQDPGNIGTLVRTAEAAGFSAVVAVGGAYPWQPKAVRASMGSVLRMPMMHVSGMSEAQVRGMSGMHAIAAPEAQAFTMSEAQGSAMPEAQAAGMHEVLERLRAGGFSLWAMALGHPNFFAQTETPDRLALFIGSEAHGVSRSVMDCASLFSLPMAGAVESLNAAAAGAICMYEIFRRKPCN